MRQARASGMLLHYNALLEGLVIDPAGERLWLAAEHPNAAACWYCTRARVAGAAPVAAS